jgi:hypothetical protein
LVAAFAFIVALVAFFFLATDDARAEAPRPAMRLTVGLVASSDVFFLAAIDQVAECRMQISECRTSRYIRL